MNNITENFNVTNIFWEYNPQFKIVSPFKELFNSDKSRGKKTSSNIMWAISLCYHPKSDLYGLPDKEERVFDMVKDKSFKLEDYSDHIELFTSSCLSQAEKSAVAWDEFMRKRDRFIKTQEYTLDTYDDFGKLQKGTADQLDKMASNTGKMYTDYAKIKKELNEEDQAVKGKGGKNLSLSDSGEI